VKKIESQSAIDYIIKLALIEDLKGNISEDYIKFLEGTTIDLVDVTTDAIFQDEEKEAYIVSKSKGILSGIGVLNRIYEIIDDSIRVINLKKDSEPFKKGERIALIKGSIKSILLGERTALNFLGHLSGIATQVSHLTSLLKGKKTHILDTRKTLPGLRILEKDAVVHGGGTNHRMGLYDMVLIKDNHIDAAGSITNAVEKVRALHGDRYKIEVETRNLNEVEEALTLGVDRIMLDNMKKPEIKRALKFINGRTEVEASGNMNKSKIKRLKNLGIDFISVGYITHSAGHSDFSMKIENKGLGKEG